MPSPTNLPHPEPTVKPQSIPASERQRALLCRVLLLVETDPALQEALNAKMAPIIVGEMTADQANELAVDFIEAAALRVKRTRDAAESLIRAYGSHSEFS